MGWFQLDSDSIAERSEGSAARIPSMSGSVIRGIVGLTIISVAGFAPWALAGRWLHETFGEAVLYLVCAAVFIVLSGPLLHRLVIGPGSLRRFYKLFMLAFGAYAVAWSVGWMWLGGFKGSLLGLAAGAAVMGVILTAAFGARGVTLKVVAVLFLGNALGYFAGEWLYATLSASRTHQTLDKLMWGVCYGVGFGAGVGLAFYFCQAAARQRLRGNPWRPHLTAPNAGS